jgi:hypothetical protein
MTTQNNRPQAARGRLSPDKTKKRPFVPVKKDGRAREITVYGVAFGSIREMLIALKNDISDQFLTSKSVEHQIKIVSARLSYGWTPEQSIGFFDVPNSAKKGYAHPIKCAGKIYASERALAVAFNIPHKILHQRLHRDKWPAEAAVELVLPPDYRELIGDVRGCIYLVEHKASQKKYVGLTIDTSRRTWQHLAAGRRGQFAPGTLQHAIAEFGADQFTFQLLIVDQPAFELPALERAWIAALGTLKPHGYNQNRGGVFGGIPKPVIVGGIRCLGLAHACLIFEISYSTVVCRLARGWSIDEAFGLIIRAAKTRTPITLDLGGGPIHYPSAAAACRHLGLRRGEVARYRYRHKLTWEHSIVSVSQRPRELKRWRCSRIWSNSTGEVR